MHLSPNCTYAGWEVGRVVEHTVSSRSETRTPEVGAFDRSCKPLCLWSSIRQGRITPSPADDHNDRPDKPGFRGPTIEYKPEETCPLTSSSTYRFPLFLFTMFSIIILFGAFPWCEKGDSPATYSISILYISYLHSHLKNFILNIYFLSNNVL